MLDDPSNKTADDNEKLRQRAAESFQRRVATVDRDTDAELDRIRLRALDCAESHRRPWFRHSLYAGAVAASVLAAVVIFSRLEPAPQMLDQTSGFELVMANTDFELLEEDLEFYQWLESELDNGDV